MPRAAAALAALCLAAGCAGPNPSLYLLPDPETGLVADAGVDILAVREVVLPLYARTVEIAVRQPDGSLRLTDGNRWAEEPQQATTRVLVAALAGATGARVVQEPWPDAVRPNLRIDVTVERLIGGTTPGDVVTLRARYVVTGPRQATLGRAEVEAPVGGEGFAALAAAQTEALTLLAREIAADVAAFPSG